MARKPPRLVAVPGFSADWLLNPLVGIETIVDVHALCVEHVDLPGLRFPLCIKRGDDRDVIIGDALDVLRAYGSHL